LIARALHQYGKRRAAPFIAINMAAIPRELIESELFGHEKGAFTGAVATRSGRFELADKGTLFLDEVGELPLDMQVKLLRVLQERVFERVGGMSAIEVDVRLVASTNRELADEVRSESFRQDLYYRLNVIPIHLPPLRERTEDIPLLASHFLQRFNERLGRSITGITDTAMDRLCSWNWPGNIRELENLMERTVLLCQEDEIGPDALGSLYPGTEDSQVQDLSDLGLKEYVRAHTAKLERARIREALEAESNNVTRAAKSLGISRKSLQVKMKDYGLRESSERGA
jgi:transcriptional regulator with GAF, ATPase, and Fis domain